MHESMDQIVRSPWNVFAKEVKELVKLVLWFVVPTYWLKFFARDRFVTSLATVPRLEVVTILCVFIHDLDDH